MRKTLLVICTIMSLTTSYANDIQVANTGLTNQNTGAHTTEIKFDVSWKNSWRTSTNEANYDGAWIFVKYRKLNTTLWQHCTLNPAGFTAPSGSSIKVTADGKGLWIYRSSNGIGDVNFTNGRVVWNYGNDGVLDTDSCEIQVYALEMVYVPQGAFYLGSGGTESYAFKDGSSSNPYRVLSEAAINYGTNAGNLYSSFGGASYVIPASYPKGFDAFWCMKYECSQQQYVDFLNNLDLARASVNGIAYFTGTHPALIAAYPERAMGGIGTAQYLAFADWAGLRPMTEMEYEKACRGANIFPLPNEYAWGSTTGVPASAVNDDGTSAESYNATANVNTNFLGRMTRSGGFATALTASNRELSGATYYGIMEMSGNGMERVVRLANNAPVLAFSASVHGDGNIAASGAANVQNWIDISNNTVFNYGTRGSGFGNGLSNLFCISDRTYMISPFADAANNFSIRVVRTAE